MTGNSADAGAVGGLEGVQEPGPVGQLGGRSSAIPPLIRQVLPGALLATVGFLVLRPIRDPDTFWHIRAGELLTQNWQFVTPDPWGAGASLPWVRNQWLPQVAMSGVFDRTGLAGVAWLASLVSVGMVALVWWMCRLRSSMLVAVVVTALATLGMVGGMSPRPQLVTFVMVAIFVEAWLRTAADWRPRWWLVPLAWIWACSHGMWFLGGVIGLLVLAGMALASRQWVRVARLSILPSLSFLVGALTPVGPQLLTSPFQVGRITQYVSEWQSLSPTNPILLGTLVLAAIPIVTGMRSRERVPWVTILLIGFALTLALTYARTIAIAAIILAPLAAQAARSLLQREPLTRRELAISAGVATLALTVAGLVAARTASEPGRGPNDLSERLSALPAGTVVCNDWAEGGWLIFKHPNTRVTMDSRVEIYTEDHIKSYAKFLRAAPGWEVYPSEMRCEYALLPSDVPVVEALTTRLKWTTVAEGANSILLRAPQ